MLGDFKCDVFLSQSAKDKAVVRPLAERLRPDGQKMGFDEWMLKPSESIPAKIEEGLEHSRVLVLCMSVNASGSDWAQLEASTCRFRDPLNQERRFIPLRLRDTPIKGSLAQILERCEELTEALKCVLPLFYRLAVSLVAPSGVTSLIEHVRCRISGARCLKR